MRRVWLVLLLIFVFLSAAFAKVDQRAIFGVGNDKFTYGISKNDDDKLSFSGYLEYDINNFKFHIDMDAFTDRGSWPDGKYRNGRLDAIASTASAKQIFVLNKHWSIESEETLGLGLIGKIYFDSVQNAQHKISKVAPAEMPYDWEKIKFSPILGLRFATNFDLGVLRFTVDADYRASLYFSSRLIAVLGISAFNNLFSLSTGYKYSANHSDSQTMDVVASVMNGAYINFRMDARPYMMNWDFYPESGFGYGTYSIDLIPIIENKTKWKNSDIYFDYSFGSLYEMELLNAGIRRTITDELTGIFEISFVSGFPIFGDQQIRAQRNYGMFEVGLAYTPIKWFVTPYIQGSMGLGTFELVYLNSTNPNMSDKNYVFPRTFVFSTDLRVGVNVLPEGLISFGNSTYQLQVFGGSHFIPYIKDLAEVFAKDKSHDANWSPKVYSPYWGLGISIGIDVLED